MYFYHMIPPIRKLQPDPDDNDDVRKKLSSGSVLVAREVLQDPNFATTVVLICIHNEEGSYGLVVNRISHMPLAEIFNGIGSITTSREILIGGPVQQNELQILDITTTPADDAFEIAPDIFIGGNWENIDKMVTADPATTRIFLGYSGWGPKQLETEVEIGAWDVYFVDIKQLLLNCHHLAGADRSAIISFLESIAK
jgi:putative transcriptional regulator